MSRVRFEIGDWQLLTFLLLPALLTVTLLLAHRQAAFNERT